MWTVLLQVVCTLCSHSVCVRLSEDYISASLSVHGVDLNVVDHPKEALHVEPCFWLTTQILRTAWGFLVGPCSLFMIHPIESRSDISSELSSTLHQHRSELQIPTAQKQSCLTLRAHIPLAAVDGSTDDHDYLYREELSTSFSFYSCGGLPTPCYCQHRIYLSSGERHISTCVWKMSRI